MLFLSSKRWSLGLPALVCVCLLVTGCRRSGKAGGPVAAPSPTNSIAVAAPPPRVTAPPVRLPEADVAAKSGRRPVASVLEEQIALVRHGISPGSIDGVEGNQTRSALAVFQRQNHLAPTGELDDATKAVLLMDAPATTTYSLTAEDLARIHPVPHTWLAKSELSSLDYESVVELLGEKAFASPTLIRTLNPSLDWSAIAAGTTVVLPNVEYPAPAPRAAEVRISLANRALEAFDDTGRLLVHFPCSIGRLAEKRPAGDLHVTVIVENPNYTFDPEIFPESAEGRELGRKLVIPPGPNNPVGVAWIGLDRPGYGIHGTPAPEQVGRTESHGCFRLANWNAAYLLHMAWVGMPVRVE